MKAMAMGLVMALLGASTSGWAMDAAGSFRAKGPGASKCSDYVTFDAQSKKVTETWWTGFVTAMNIMQTDTYDYIGNVRPEEVTAMLDRRCTAYPNELVAVAMYRVLQELHPNRVRKGPNS
jgi:hypothetical protein